MQSDEELMREFQKGKPEAFEELFRRYVHLIYAFFRRRLTDTSRAEDLAQETFMVILPGGERYEERAKFRTYLYAVALKLLWGERRRESRDRLIDRNVDELSQEHDPSTSVWIREALGRLDGRHREVLMLREYEQLSYEEIAELLAIPVNTVRSRLFRARAELKASLEQQITRETSQ